MRKKKAVENYRKKEDEAQRPDCTICAGRKTCALARENSFCTRFRSSEPEPVGPDPNELWKRGEEVEF